MKRAIECICGQRIEFSVSIFEVACPECHRQWGALPGMALADGSIFAKNLPPQKEAPLMSDEEYEQAMSELREEDRRGGYLCMPKDIETLRAIVQAEHSTES